MSRHHHNAARAGQVVSVLRALALLAACLFAPAALAVDSGDIVVVSVRGEVHLTLNGADRKARAGVVLELPATVRTGRDGAIELKQGNTTVSVAADTQLEFPALEKPGAPVDRIVQPRGNAFYNIGKREGRRLRVETPYLVGVVKGTQFNVAAHEDATTISLFEGLLEIRAVDDSSVIDLKAGEIASRRRGDKSISVLKMEGGKAPATGTRQQNPATPVPSRGDSLADIGNAGLAARLTDLVPSLETTAAPVGAELRTPLADVSVSASIETGDGNAALATSASVDAGNVLDSNANASVSVDAGSVAVDVGNQSAIDLGPVSADVGVSAGAGVDASGLTADVAANAGAIIGPAAVDVGLGADVDVGAGGASVDVTNSATVDAGPISVGLDTSISVDAGPGGASVDISHGTQIDAGPVSAGLDAAAGVDVGTGGVAVDVSTDTLVDAGPISADIGTDTSLDVGTGGVAVDVATDTTIDAGPITAGVNTDTAVDLGAGTVDAGVGADIVAGPIAAPVGVDTSVDISTGTVDLGVTVGGLDVGLGLDLGLGQDDTETETSTPPPTDTGNNGTIDVGGLLDGLLRRPGRR
jgi:hypothetical protein